MPLSAFSLPNFVKTLFRPLRARRILRARLLRINNDYNNINRNNINNNINNVDNNNNKRQQ